MFSIPYLIIKNKLSSIEELNEVNWFGYQYLPDENGAIWLKAPACFIEFASSPSTPYPGGLNRVALNFRLHVVIETYEEGDSRFLPNDNFVIVDQLYNKVHKAISNTGLLTDIPELDIPAGTNTHVFDTPQRRTVAPIHNITGLLVMTADYYCDMEDYMANPDYESILANLNLIRN